MNNQQSYVQLQMVWPERLLDRPPQPKAPPGYVLRTFRPGDEPQFFRVMALAGWPDWDDETLKPWRVRIPPGCWFMAIHEASGEIVATAMGLDDPSDLHPDGGELGWVAGDPAHAGRGVGLAVCSVVTSQLLATGYRNIHLYTEHWRLAAIKTYFKLGYVPFLYLPEMWERWRSVCFELQWPFLPQLWR